MNKVDLIDLVAAKAHITKKEAEAAINALVEGTEEALVRGEDVKVSGFGSFAVKQRAARKGVNPKTGKAIDIPATKAVVFKPSKLLKEKVQ
ncbi:MAG: HU family DNA-binding protein [Bacilli bacterium]|jgi:DNA-binding protein HU-beta